MLWFIYAWNADIVYWTFFALASLVYQSQMNEWMKNRTAICGCWTCYGVRVCFSTINRFLELILLLLLFWLFVDITNLPYDFEIKYVWPDYIDDGYEMPLTLTSIHSAKKETKDRMGDSTKTKKQRIGMVCLTKRHNFFHTHLAYSFSHWVNGVCLRSTNKSSSSTSTTTHKKSFMKTKILLR